MSCIEKLPHNECGSSDALQVFQDDDGSFSAFCFACDSYVSDPYQDKPSGYKPETVVRTPESIEKELQELSLCRPLQLPTRKLTEESLAYFGVGVEVSEVDGVTPTAAYLPYWRDDGNVAAYKVRLLSKKKMWSVGNMSGVKLFGWHKAIATGAKTLYITEGEYDAVALYQALKDKSKGTAYASYDPAVVSLTSGTGGTKRDITNHLSEIRSTFKEVVLVFDQDEPGEAAVRTAMEILPTARTAGTLPAKDPNECVIKGRSKGLVSAVLWNTGAPRNSKLVDMSTLFSAGRVQATMGMSWPWPVLTELTRGCRFGETYYLGAGVKMGKSELVNTIAAHFVTEHNLPVLLAKPEESNVRSTKVVLGKIAGRIFHDPNVPFDYEAYDAASTKIGPGMVYLLDVYQHLGWESLRGEIMVAHAAGCRVVFIDPISNLVNGVSASETNTKLQEIAQDIAAMAKDLNIMVFLFCHLKSPDVGSPHERGGKVYSHQFTGSRAMARSCNMMLGLEGNKDNELDLYERNTRRLVVLEDREYGATGHVDLYWDEKSGCFHQIDKK